MNEARDGRTEAIGEEGYLHALARDQLAMAVAHLLCLRRRGICKRRMGKL